MTYEDRLDRMRDHCDEQEWDSDWDANTQWANTKQREDDRELQDTERFDR